MARPSCAALIILRPDNGQRKISLKAHQVLPPRNQADCQKSAMLSMKASRKMHWQRPRRIQRAGKRFEHLPTCLGPQGCAASSMRGADTFHHPISTRNAMGVKAAIGQSGRPACHRPSGLAEHKTVRHKRPSTEPERPNSRISARPNHEGRC